MMNQSVSRAELLKRTQNMKRPTARQIMEEFDRLQRPSLQPPWMQDPGDIDEDDVFTYMDLIDD